jgi:outer membrane receptor protein involved in Fe transport
MLDNRKLLLVISASALALAGTPAFAQDEPDAAEMAADAGANEIVVTGSRIARRDFEAASPIVTLGADAVAATGQATLEGALNQLPQFSAGSTAFSNDLNATGQATLNLRGLGAQRNLVLLDGRHLQPSNSSQVIDINTIPSILVGGTEIISGGASAVYGSDAISGVVNFKVRELDGVEISGQNTLTERGDGGIREISIGAGTRFADGRGRIIVGAALPTATPSTSITAPSSGKIRACRERSRSASSPPAPTPPASKRLTMPSPLMASRRGR